MLIIALAFGGCAVDADRRFSKTTPEARAVAFLTREVPAWKTENGCFSCHNNGDAARALYLAKRSGYVIKAASLTDTLRWVSRPMDWDNNQGDPGFSDQRLADIQFAASLLGSIDAGFCHDTSALKPAAARVAGHQSAAGHWAITPEGTVGAPATYGNALATHMALRVLKAAGMPAHEPSIQRGRQWLAQCTARNVPDNAALVFEFYNDPDPVLHNKALEAAHWLVRAQNPDHGWGPFPQTATEAFDTALALLALSRVRNDGKTAAALRSGRQRLSAMQREDGSWPATTRPTGNESYAQQMSTTAWAAMALLETDMKAFSKVHAR